MLLGTLDASLLGKTVAGKGVGNWQGTIRAVQDF